VLARFSDPELFDDAVEAVRKAGGVKRWDAVDGHYQMVVKVVKDHGLELGNLKQTFQLQELIDLRVSEDREPDGWATREDCFSYLFLETDPSGRAKVRDEVCRIEQCLVVNAVEGSYDTVLILKGDTFATIDRVIDAKIAPLDGILRFRQNRIISSNPV